MMDKSKVEMFAYYIVGQGSASGIDPYPDPATPVMTADPFDTSGQIGGILGLDPVTGEDNYREPPLLASP